MTTVPGSPPASQQAAVDAALLVLESMGLSLEDLTAACKSGAFRPDAGGNTEERPSAELRAQLHGMWSAVAGGWEKHADYVDARGAGVTRGWVRTGLGRGSLAA